MIIYILPLVKLLPHQKQKDEKERFSFDVLRSRQLTKVKIRVFSFISHGYPIQKLEHLSKSKRNETENDVKMKNKNDVNIFAELRKRFDGRNGGKLETILFTFTWHDLILARSAERKKKTEQSEEMQSKNQYHKQINVQT